MSRLKLYSAIYENIEGDTVKRISIWFPAYNKTEALQIFFKMRLRGYGMPTITCKFLDIWEGLYKWNYEINELVAIPKQKIKRTELEVMYHRIQEIIKKDVKEED